MRTKSLTLIAFLALALAAPVANASDEPVSKGYIEFAPTLSFNRSTYQTPNNGPSGSLTHVNLDIGFGYCVNRDWEATGGLLYQHRAAATDGRNAFGMAFGARYNFPMEGSVIPFASLSLGALQYSENGEVDRSYLLPMVRLGIRSLMWKDNAVSVSIGYQHEQNPKSAIERSANLFDIGVGMSFFKHASNF